MSATNQPKNEATFEAHLGAVLKTLFPAGGVSVTHQFQFSLRLGHHDKKIDGRKGWVSKGRLDVLLSSGSEHAAVLELKHEDLDLTDDDRDQGLSYARLLQPMPPLVIVSNGRVTRFYTTIDGSPWIVTAARGRVSSQVANLVAQLPHDHIECAETRGGLVGASRGLACKRRIGVPVRPRPRPCGFDASVLGVAAVQGSEAALSSTGDEAVRDADPELLGAGRRSRRRSHPDHARV